MTPIDVLDSVLTKTGDVIAEVQPDQAELPTPCPDYNVAALQNHIVGWIQVFDAGRNGRELPEDPGGYECGPDPVAEFRTAASSLVQGWAEHGTEGTVKISSGSDMPAAMVFNMTLMEYLAHGWDLATATGQAPPYTEAEAAFVLERALETLPPEYQGEGMAFGAIVPVPDEAPALDRFIGFVGRQP